MKNSVTNETCKKCAACCKHYPFVELSPREISALEQETALHCDLFTNQKGDSGDEYFLQFKENGDCYFLNEKNGCFSCAVYAARPGICKKYPSIPTEKAACSQHWGRLVLEQSSR